MKNYGAKGDGVTDDTDAIEAAMAAAKKAGIPAVYFPDGSYMIGQAGDGGGIIKLVDGVGLTGTGPATCHIKLTGGRNNPSPMFCQDYVNTPIVSNVTIQGIDFNGNSSLQTFDSDYQYCTAFNFHNGKNIEVKNCKFQSFRGDGLFFGDTFEPSLNLRMVTNIDVHDCEFFNIYREAAMFCAVNDATFYNNNVHGDGYLVGGVDIERHSVNETVLNVSVYSNTFNFRDGYGPVERGGPKVRYRRAVTMGFFYNGYKNGIADSLSGHYKVYNNKIYQGQIDCWGMLNVSISGNNFKNSYENIAGVSFLTAPAINISDNVTTRGLINVSADNNIIDSDIGNGIAFKNYSKVTANGNTIIGTPLDGISVLSTSGCFYGNKITDAGTAANPCSGILINGNASGLYVSTNQASNTTTGSNRTMDYVIKIGSANNGTVAPQILSNKGKNMIKGILSEYYYQAGYVITSNNVAM
ncbi:glycosyl hydrolase family 28-related protein [Mucilaginibacter celer]|uniref:glycosyl hydrolase family 28-related protein n=1 Tax=Mucilaginibacter celer TaxID=2305508 RepID=UPI0013CE6E10|nr:glycosyl hydrolase family 28-related protein [Mucilaginibacter celer]